MHPSPGYVSTDYLRAAAQLFAPIKQYSYEKMRIADGHRVLDAGCGPGIDAIALNSLVGEQGQVVGIDHDDNMLVEARQGTPETCLPERVYFTVGSVTTLPFVKDHFDACRSERLFIHLNQVDQALQEIIRVTKSGGHIVSVETDMASLSCDSDHIDIERRLVRYRTENLLNNGYAARRLYRQFTMAGLNNIELETFPLYTTDRDVYRFMSMMEETEQHALDTGIITPKELEIWRSELNQRQANGSFFASINIIVISAQKL